jgi:hypothetical protein
VGLLGGFRYLNLEESLNISQTSGVLSGGVGFYNGVPVPPGGFLGVSDGFDTQNNFYGGQLGAQVVGRWGPLALTALVKCALGTMDESAGVHGQTTLTQFGHSYTTAAGVLALPTNSGTFGHYQFAVVPEGRLTLSVQVTANLSVSAGYTFLYASDVLRPGPQIDRGVNPSLVPSSQQFGTISGPVRPAFQFHESDFWTQGLTAGLSISF